SRSASATAPPFPGNSGRPTPRQSLGRDKTARVIHFSPNPGLRALTAAQKTLGPPCPTPHKPKLGRRRPAALTGRSCYTQDLTCKTTCLFREGMNGLRIICPFRTSVSKEYCPVTKAEEPGPVSTVQKHLGNYGPRITSII